MTARKADAWLRQVFVGPRRHVTFVAEFSLIEFVDAECARLGVSRGVFFELLIRACRDGRVRLGEADVYRYVDVVRSELVRQGQLGTRRSAMREYVFGKYGRSEFRKSKRDVVRTGK